MQDKIAELLARYWYEPRSIIVGLVILFVVLSKLIIDFRYQAATSIDWILIAALLGGAWLLWYWSTRPPRAKKGKIGFVIALQSENEEQRDIIQNDLIKEIQNVLEAVQRIAEFHIVVLPKWHADKLTDADSAARYGHI